MQLRHQHPDLFDTLLCICNRHDAGRMRCLGRPGTGSNRADCLQHPSTTSQLSRTLRMIAANLKGRKISSMTPAARLESVPCKARPTARLAAPRMAMRLVVWMPNCESTASTVTVRIR
jgi:hypothetical protein